MEVKGFGISNTELEHFFKNNVGNLSENFVGIFPANKKSESLDEVSGKETKYPFMVPNTNPARKLRIHWWSFLDTDETNTLYLFDRLGIYGLLNQLSTMTWIFSNVLYPDKSSKYLKRTIR